MKTLLIGPAIGELGWVLMRYNPYCRAKAAEGYDKVVAMVPPGEEYLWEFVHEFTPVKRPSRSDRWLHGPGLPCKIPAKIKAKYADADKVMMTEKICTKATYLFHQFGEKHESKGYDIIIHARATKKYNQQNRNYSVQKFSKIINDLGVRAACIGSKKGASKIEGCADLRGIHLKELCDVIANSCVVIGSSSGPMHLASLCGTPHVVFTGKAYEKAIKGNNRKRYTRLWNPFQTPVTVLDSWGWKPPVREVIKAVRKYL